MTAPALASSPREFGAALRAARERTGIAIDVIAERTKIARRVLELLEAGEFAKLPNRVFVRLFLQQYLAIIGEKAADWIPAFEAAWQRFEDASQPWEVAAPGPSRGARLAPWLIGLVVVVGGLVGVVLVERQHNGEGSAPIAAPAPEILLSTPVPPTPLPAVEPAAAPESQPPSPAAEPPVTAAPPSQAPVAATPAAPAAASTPLESGTLSLRAGGRPCWVSVHVSGERPQSRLLPAGTEWRLAAGGRAVTLVVGDGGALAIGYLGEQRERAGADGEVVHLQLGPAPTSAGPKP
jgi:cytoskeletal protein RodZ